MESTPEKNQQKVVKFAQELLLEANDNAAVTPSLINEKIDEVLAFRPLWGENLDREAAVEELIRRFSLWIGQDATLSDNRDHEQWLTTGRKKSWRYWQRYCEWLERSLSDTAVVALDRSTDKVLGLLEDPERNSGWSRRGLVVGHVQSGKTGNYTGLICKAADAGYKIIIVLAGLHNNLRSQTQIRLDEGFLGFTTKPILDVVELVGVGEINPDPKIRPNYATNRSDKGDFNTKAAQHLGISPEERPWLFVVKKNKTVLTRLLNWIHKHVANTHDAETGKKTVTHLPLLLIDDEADNASVDTGAQTFDEQGNPDLDHDPKAINSLIRKLLHSFSRSAYVGYTATPFANIFIHERGATTDEGDDLFPSSFIINLGAPSNYVGPVRLFGLGWDEEDRDGGLPLTRIVKDATNREGTNGWMPHKHKNGYQPLFNGNDCIPTSLAEAINSFILACTVRHLRKRGKDHSSMLIHVTRFNSVQQAVFYQVESYVNTVHQKIRRKIGCEQLLADLESLWNIDFIPSNETLQSGHPDLGVSALPKWQEVLDSLPEILADIKIRMINGTAKDALDYADHEGTGLKVIAIGGDKLARGLTLEGLCTSYFLRASRMYDTLMQMGRWFGYRSGYLDVCRLYTTSDLIEWFCHITDAGEELREEFDLMAESGGTPRDYGLKVQAHPVLMVTSQVKMRAAKNLMLSFSGCLVETVALHSDSGRLQKNLDAANRLICTMESPNETNPTRLRTGKKQEWKGYLWNNVPSSEIISFLISFETHPAAKKVNTPILAQFIEEMNKANELTSWTVALIGSREGKETTLGNGLKLQTLFRESNKDITDRYSIGRLLSPRDESIDLDNSEWEAALSETRKIWHADPARRKARSEPDEPNGLAVRKVRGHGTDIIPANPERGLLLLYALNAQEGGLPEGTPEIIAFGISFPGSSAGKKVKYEVNNVLWEQWEQEYGSPE